VLDRIPSGWPIQHNLGPTLVCDDLYGRVLGSPWLIWVHGVRLSPGSTARAGNAAAWLFFEFRERTVKKE